MRNLLCATIGLTAIGAAFGIASAPPAPVQMVTVFPAPAAIELEVRAQAMTADEPAQPVHATDIALVFSAGSATYMKLADVTSEDAPKHGKPKLYSDDYIETAVTPVKLADVPAAYSHWQDRKVSVDNKCTTTVTGFAIVSRLTGETGYASVDGDRWTARNVLDNGSMVLAAKLAGCAGTFARDAALPPVIVPDEIANAHIAGQAQALLIASQPARDAQHEYDAEFQRGKHWWEDQSAQISTKIVRHPTTGVTFVSVHGSIEHGCGDPEINVWGLFRVEADGSLAAVQLRKLDDLWQIDQLIDIDNDGELELIGKPWLGLDTVVVRGSGEELERLSLQFFGCPC